jgi:hypothetical protein
MVLRTATASFAKEDAPWERTQRKARREEGHRLSGRFYLPQYNLPMHTATLLIQVLHGSTSDAVAPAAPESGTTPSRL